MSKEHRMEPLDEGDSKYSKIASQAQNILWQSRQEHYCDEPESAVEMNRTSEDVGDQDYSGGSEEQFKKIGDRFVNDEMDKG